jgi:hypothetical protein
MVDQLVRRVNLLAMLEEDEPDVPIPPEHAALDWTESEIRAYYESGGTDAPAPKPKAAIPTTMRAMVAKERGTARAPKAVRPCLNVHDCVWRGRGMRVLQSRMTQGLV